MYNPVATYRLQFNKAFTLRDLDNLIPYFRKLGVKTIYASPIFKAVPDSMHGYDVVNPYEINPEIGTEAELRTVIQRLQAEEIGWIQDIVPNHMAFHHTNLWLMDVLEKGSLSVYASFFDIPAAGDFFSSRLMVPFLGKSLEEVIRDKELQLIIQDNGLLLKYEDQFYPLNTRSFRAVLDSEEVQSMQSVKQFLLQLGQLHDVTDSIQYALRSHELKMQFGALLNELETRSYIEKGLSVINNDPEKLTAITGAQSYRLCSWQETTREINYRRFFTVNSLICLNMQSEKVFHQYHKLIKTFVDEGLFNGIRVDHIDGLYNPTEYLERLRKLVGAETYIVIEKILGPNESLEHWPVEGTTGYDFLALINNLVTRNRAENKFSGFYKTLTNDTKPVEQKIIDKKSVILHQYMGGELNNLYNFFQDKNLADVEIPAEDIKHAIAEFLIHCPVYRHYGNTFPLKPGEEKQVHDLLMHCKKDKPQLINAFELLEDVFINRPKTGDSDFNLRAVQFYMRCMQFSGPIMAKGVEDTLMYTFNRFVAHNEVGDSPEFFGLDMDEFHELMQKRQQEWPLAMNATSTHDTKRGEDARMRLNVLPDVAEEWIARVKQWMEWNQRYKTNQAPDLNDEYFIYQTLIGSYPCLPVFGSAQTYGRGEDERTQTYGRGRDERAVRLSGGEVQPGGDFIQRLEEYFTKAFREAKRYSDWADPDEQYEGAVIAFVTEILKPGHPFFKSFQEFQQKITDFGIINSLSQTVLKFTCPGVPDTYQGTTFWDLSLVDPDNRREVDYKLSQQQLTELSDAPVTPEFLLELWNSRNDAGLKLWLTHKLFTIRNAYKDVYRDGQYIPLRISGKYKDHCLAFARVHKGIWLITVVPLNVARITEFNQTSIKPDWSDTKIILPEHAPLRWTNLLTTTKGKHSGELPVSEILTDFPSALLKLEDSGTSRNSGVLLSIASLPSAFGIGDLGKEARAFADFLQASKQRIWQLLPLNITSSDAGYSPYSSYSNMAGNPLLISPEGLVELGLLEEKDVEPYEVWNNGKIKYRKAESIRERLLNRAWLNFKDYGDIKLIAGFEKFQERESYWLNDFALFELIRARQNDSPWYEWPEHYKKRDRDSLSLLQEQNVQQLEKIKWIQFIFHEQWKTLRTYCNNRNIKLLGDIPFYVSYNSADVWANPELFSLDETGKMKGVAGVPPDYFNSDGQLWGMPVFNWNVLKDTNYKWWIKRLRKNLELFDEIRLDHFRAFVDYWEVPAGNANAKGGSWRPGPGKDFFDAVEKEFGSLPFVAEDLGEVNPDVFILRDELKLPGMKVLQFAFDEDMAESIYAPHNFTENFIVYTGTHDNNTTRGWYRKDITDEHRKRIDNFFNARVTDKTISAYLMDLAYGSIARTVIIPMQDILNLKENDRMNVPSTNAGNWLWQMKGLPGQSIQSELLRLTRLYNR